MADTLLVLVFSRDFLTTECVDKKNKIKNPSAGCYFYFYFLSNFLPNFQSLCLIFDSSIRKNVLSEIVYQRY